MAAVAPAAASSVSLVWKEITYTVPLKKGEKKTILDHVSGFVEAGSLVALMGPSGSGKSTLLDVLSDRISGKEGLSGELLVNGKVAKKGLMKRIGGFVPQQEYLQGAMTVRENLMFSAELRLGKHISKADKAKRVEEVIKELNLEKVADSKVGDGSFIRGISGGERRRTSIGMELVTAPMLLFLDEPTSGLDSSTATSVMILLKKLARSGKTIVASIHQPKYAIWQQFDELVLLSNGRMVYSGQANPEGQNDAGVLAFLAKNGFVCESFNSPPDFILDVVTEDESRQRRRALIESGQDPDDPAATTMSRRKSVSKAATSGSLASAKKVVDELAIAESGVATTYADIGGSAGQSTAIELGPTLRAESYQSNPTSVTSNDALLPGTVSTIPANNAVPIADLFLKTEPYYNELVTRIAEYEKSGTEMPPPPERPRPGFAVELYVVLKRTILAVFRNPRTWIIQVASNIFLAFLFGILFWRQGYTQESAQNRNGIAFFTVQFLVFSNMGAVELFLVDRRQFYHERSNGYYGTLSYFISKVFGDLIPLRIIPAFLFGTIVYFCTNFQAVASKFFFYILVLFCTAFAGTSIAFAISSYIEVFALGTLLLGACFLIMMIFGGLFVNLSTIPVWLRWLQWTSIFKFGIEAIDINEFTGLVFECPPAPQPCLFPTGEAYLAFMGFDPSMMWPNVGLLLAWSALYLIIAYVGLALRGKK